LDPHPESDDVRFFNRWAGAYEKCAAQFFIDHLHRSCLDLVEKEATGNTLEVLADIGCGTGRLLRNAGKRWPAARFLGVDPSQGMLAVARLLMPNGIFCAGSAESLPLPDHSVDVVFSTLSIHHWTDPKRGMVEIMRILHTGGYFCLADIQVPAVLSGLIGHFKGNHPDSWNRLFIQARLTVLAVDHSLAGWGLLMLGKKGDINSPGMIASPPG